MNPLEELLAMASGGQGAQALASRPVGPNQAVARGEGLAVKRRGSVAWEPLASGGPVGLEDMVRFPAGGELLSASGAAQRVGPDSLMAWTDGGWSPTAPSDAMKGRPVVSGPASFRPR